MHLGLWATIIGASLWGFSGTCGQFLFTNYHLDAFWLTSVRMSIAGILLLIIGFTKDHNKMLTIITNKRDLFDLMIFSICGLLFCQLSYMLAINYSNSATAAILQYLNPIFIMIASCIMVKRLPYKKEVITIIIAILGVVIIATHGKITELKMTELGLFWGIISAIAAAIYTMQPVRLMNKYDSMTVCGYGMLIGGLSLGLIGGGYFKNTNLDLQGYLALAGIILLGTIGAFSLYLYGVSQIGSMKASLLASMEPVSATLCMIIWLHAEFVPVDLIGFGLILSTIFILTYNGKVKD